VVKAPKVIAVETLHRITGVPDEAFLQPLRETLRGLEKNPLVQMAKWKLAVRQYSVIDSQYSLPTCFYHLCPGITDVSIKKQTTFILDEVPVPAVKKPKAKAGAKTVKETPVAKKSRTITNPFVAAATSSSSSSSTFTGNSSAAAAASSSSAASSEDLADGQVAPPKPNVQVMWQDDGEWFRIPRCLGIRLYGLPTVANRDTSMGEPMTQGLVFQGELSETPERPQLSATSTMHRQLQESDEHSKVLRLPCGAGKTRCGTHMVLALGRKTLVMCHMEVLLHQMKTAFETNIPGIKVGIIQGPRCEVEGMDVVIAMVQTLWSRTFPDELRRSFGTVMVDECHHAAAPQYSKTICRFPAQFRIGLSATPKAKFGKTELIFQLLGTIGFEADRPPRPVDVLCINYDNKRNEEEIKCKQPQLAYTLLKQRLARDWKRDNVLLDEIMSMVAEGRKMLVFTDTHKHIDKILKSLAFRSRYLAVPVDAVEYSGRLKRKERAEKLMHQVIVCTPSIAKEALDCPTIDTVVYFFIVGEPEQSSGRALRQDEGAMDHDPKIVYLSEHYGILSGLGRKNYRYFHDQQHYKYTYKSVVVPQEPMMQDDDEEDEDEEGGDAEAGSDVRAAAPKKCKAAAGPGAPAKKKARVTSSKSSGHGIRFM
jgi:superfamily II DNA or RNA helicase